ncbi:MAG TPA: ion transporter [Armatimonadota bacterium]|nr:ion transporter [Armatimonadota bacterium]
MMSRYRKVQARIFELVEPTQDDCLVDKAFNLFIIALIFTNQITIILSSMQSFQQRYHDLFICVEITTIIIFTIEYCLRIWSCTSMKRYRHPLWGRLRYAVTPLVLIDLLAIVPFYLPMLFPFDLRFLRLMRLFRALRIMKVIRYSESLKTLAHVFREKKTDLTVTIAFASIILLIASSMVYYVESPVQPDKFPDIPSAMWWGVVTLTTVGYGDVYPITSLGKFLGGVIAFLGIGLFALPAGILGSGFVEEMQQRRMQTGHCPHCGRPYDKSPAEENGNTTVENETSESHSHILM